MIEFNDDNNEQKLHVLIVLNVIAIMMASIMMARGKDTCAASDRSNIQQ